MTLVKYLILQLHVNVNEPRCLLMLCVVSLMTIWMVFPNMVTFNVRFSYCIVIGEQ